MKRLSYKPSLPKMDRKSHDCVFDASTTSGELRSELSPKRNQSFGRMLSPKKNSGSPRDASEPSFELRSPSSSPRKGELAIKKIKLIGRGSSGTSVYEAKIGGARYCVKELPIESASEEELDQFYTEIEILKTLPTVQGLGIIEYIGYQKTISNIQIVMSLYTGSLHNCISKLQRKKKQFSVYQIAKISKQLLTGLSILHNRNLMHRDLKSCNVLYDGVLSDFDDMTFVLADFGESKIISKTQKAKTITGTPGWIAPEVLEKGYTFSADMWSFGMILYEMMMLKFPYYEHKFASQATAEGKIPKILDKQQQQFTELLPLWEDCVMIDPKKRPTSKQALSRIQTILDHL